MGHAAREQRYAAHMFRKPTERETTMRRRRAEKPCAAIARRDSAHSHGSPRAPETSAVSMRRHPLGTGDSAVGKPTCRRRATKPTAPHTGNAICHYLKPSLRAPPSPHANKSSPKQSPVTTEPSSNVIKTLLGISATSTVKKTTAE